MTAMTMKMTYQNSLNKTAAPVTARGRALHTIDWFMNGIPATIDHDNLQYDIRDIYVSVQNEY